KLERQLEKGDYEVLSVEGAEDEVVFFAANQGDFRQQNIFSVKLDGSDFRRLSQPDGSHHATFSEDGKHWLDRYSNNTTPPQWSMCATGASCSKVWESRSVAEYGLVPQKFLEFKAEDGTTLFGQLLLPSTPPTGKIPVVVYVYGGPAA